MKRGFFGTDGVRGEVGRPPMTPDFLARLGFAVGRVLLSNKSGGEVLISKDTRLSGYMVESALEAGLSAAGMDVLLSGPLPTSAISYLTQTLRLDGGVMISASHNPFGDNGVKLFAADGNKLPDETELAIADFFADNAAIVFDGHPGRARRIEDAAGRYIEFCKRAVPPRMTLRGLRVVVDCANGAAYHVAPPVFHELGADVIAIGDKPDGFNINVGCGVLSPAAAMETVLQNRADVGVLLDGDADRVHLVDEKGRLWDGDAILLLIADYLQKRKKPPPGVVGTVLSNRALETELQRRGIAFERADVGDRQISRELRRRGWTLGGEPSGHLLLHHLHNTGDGIISALQVLAAMRDGELSLSDLLGDFSPHPQSCRTVAISRESQSSGESSNVLQQKSVQECLSQARTELGENGRVVVRESGTEKVLRIMVEGADKQKNDSLAAQIESAIKTAAK